ncbi:septum formation protein Maf [Patescibacteria group bacterium]|nr:septum formation protein Maf [Patescibacteria group bacterium]
MYSKNPHQKSDNPVSGKTIVLASASSRRISLLQGLNVDFEVVPSSFDEPPFDETKMTPKEYAIYNATEKARDVAAKFHDKNSIIIGMDTVGEYEGRVLGKPEDLNHAREMINFLNGTTHQVITGICLIDNASGKEIQTFESTKVTFTKMSDKEIEKYLEIGAWQGVAAGYAIQGVGSLFIEKIEGDYFNVVGFPIFRFAQAMKEIGVPII